MRTRLHRFYVGDSVELKHDFWLHDERLVWQWRKVLRMHNGQELVLFDGVRSDRLYRLVELGEREAHLEYVTDFERQVPKREVYLLWSLLKKDKNEWVMQKATELGVSHFVPIIADRSEKMGFDMDRAKRIVVEAAEQCGRSDIPVVREPMSTAVAIDELMSTVRLYVCEQGNGAPAETDTARGLLIGPEGGWSDEERQLFTDRELPLIGLGDFTLRAETAAITGAGKLV